MLEQKKNESKEVSPVQKEEAQISDQLSEEVKVTPTSNEEVEIVRVPSVARSEKLKMIKAELSELLAAHKEELSFDVALHTSNRHEINYGGQKFSLMFIISDPA